MTGDFSTGVSMIYARLAKSAWWAARKIDPPAVALQFRTAPDNSAEFPAIAADVSEPEGCNDTETTQDAKATKQATG